MKKMLSLFSALLLGALAMFSVSLFTPHHNIARADSGSRDVICTLTISPGGITTATTFTSASIPCPQVHMGDFVMGVSALTTDPGAVTVTGKVVAAGSVKVMFSNATAGTITPASDTYSVIIKPRYVSP